jgi:hypothetical protein
MTDDIGPEPQALHEKVAEQIEAVREELSTEQAEAQQDRQWLSLIGLSTGILSALAAIAAMQAGYLANEGTLAQIRASDAWAFYQAQSTKRHLAESDVLLLKSLQRPIPAELTSQIQTLQQKQATIQSTARKLQAESTENLHRHELFARSVAALQVAISLGAVAVLLRKRSVWYLGLGLAVIGLGFMVMGSLPSNAHPDREAVEAPSN